MFGLITALAPSLLGIVKDIIPRFSGKKIDEAQEKEIALAIQTMLIKASQDEKHEFNKFFLEYEGAAKDVPKIIVMLRSSVRPVLTYVLAGAFIYGFLHPEAYSTEQMSLLWNLNLLSLGFWYGERALKNLGFTGQNMVKRAQTEKEDKGA